jgi:dsRNA-specific ribonuclease
MKELEDLLGYTFKNRSLLERALTHSSFATKGVPVEQPVTKDLNF